jgi:hypothetical protein
VVMAAVLSMKAKLTSLVVVLTATRWRPEQQFLMPKALLTPTMTVTTVGGIAAEVVIVSGAVVTMTTIVLVSGAGVGIVSAGGRGTGTSGVPRQSGLPTACAATTCVAGARGARTAALSMTGLGAAAVRQQVEPEVVAMYAAISFRESALEDPHAASAMTVTAAVAAAVAAVAVATAATVAAAAVEDTEQGTGEHPQHLQCHGGRALVLGGQGACGEPRQAQAPPVPVAVLEGGAGGGAAVAGRAAGVVAVAVTEGPGEKPREGLAEHLAEAGTEQGLEQATGGACSAFWVQTKMPGEWPWQLRLRKDRGVARGERKRRGGRANKAQGSSFHLPVRSWWFLGPGMPGRAPPFDSPPPRTRRQLLAARPKAPTRIPASLPAKTHPFSTVLELLF